MAEKKEGAVIPAANGGAVALPEDMVAKLAEYAKQTQQTETVKGQFFGTRAGVLSFNKQPLPNNSMDVIILSSMFENVYYPEKFNANKIESPLCFAFSHSGLNMVPHDMATEQQAESCATCIQSKWTLDPVDNKRRKPCKEQRRLSCLPVSATDEASKVADATVGYLRVPVTSVKFWAAYAQKLAGGGIPPFAAVTRVTIKPDAQTQVRFEFECLRTITDPDVLAELFKRHDLEADAMAFPYEKRNTEAPVPPEGTPPIPPAPGTQPAGKF
jgi:hypothetical protein